MKEWPSKFSLSVERKDTGLWVVTSPEIPGLLVGDHVLMDALEEVPRSLAALRLAALPYSPEPGMMSEFFGRKLRDPWG